MSTLVIGEPETLITCIIIRCYEHSGHWRTRDSHMQTCLCFNVHPCRLKHVSCASSIHIIYVLCFNNLTIMSHLCIKNSVAVAQMWGNSILTTATLFLQVFLPDTGMSKGFLYAAAKELQWKKNFLTKTSLPGMYHMYCSWNCNDNKVTNNTECNDDQVSLTFQISRILAMSPASDNWVTLYCWWGWSGRTRLFKARRASSHTLSTADSQTRHDNRTLITICTSQSTAECSCLMSYDRRDSVKWTIASVTDALINTWQHKPHVYHKHTHAWNWVIMFYTVLKYTYMHTYMHKTHWFLFLELLQVRLNLWELMNRCSGGCPPVNHSTAS